MMKNLRYLFSTFLLLLVAGVTWAAKESVTFSEQGYSNAEEIALYTGTNFSIDFDKGTNSNTPKYYDTGTAIRVYGGGTFTVKSNDNITKIVITFGSGDGSNEITADVGSYSSGTWTGSAKSVTFTIGGTSGHRRLSAFAVTTESGDPEPKYYLAGTFDGWGDGVEFTYNEDNNTYTATQAVENGTEFKVKYGLLTDPNNFTWYGGLTGDDNNYRVYDEWYENIHLDTQGNNFVIEISKPTTLTFTLTANETAAPTLTVTGWPEPTYYLTGSFNNWGQDSENVEFTDNGDGTYTAEQAIEADGEFKILDSEGNWYGGPTPDDNYGVNRGWYENLPMATDGKNYQINEAGTYTFTITVTDEAGPRLTVTGWPEAPVVVDGDYVKVTSDNDLVDGEYLIVYEEGSVAFNGGLETLDAVANTIEVTISDNKIVSNATVDAATFTFDSTAETFLSKSGYYIGQTSDANGLASSTTTAYTNTVSIDEDGNAVILASGGAYLRYNSANNQTRFRYYKSSTYTGQKAIQLYRKVAATEETIDVTIGETGYATLYYGDLNLVVPEGVTATTYKVAEGSLTESKTYEPNDVIPAATGVVLYSAEPATYSFAVTSDEGEGDEYNMLLGSDTETTYNDAGFYYYILSKSKDGSKVGFFFQNEDGSVVNNGAHKAYLRVAIDEAGGAKGWSFDGEATGINTIDGNETITDNEVYNLSGVRVSGKNLPKGIYIVNGKKMVVK